MKVKAHIRVAKGSNGKSQLTATVKPSTAPLTMANGTPLPTIAFAVVFEVPDAMFRQAEQVIATLTIPESQAQIAADITERVA